MAVTGAGVFAGPSSPVLLRQISPSTGNFKSKRFVLATVTSRQSVSSTEPAPPAATTATENGGFEKKHETAKVTKRGVDSDSENRRLSLKDYFEQSKDMLRSDGGPPRWFSPLECASRSNNSPLLLFLPGIDGVGLGLTLHHQRLGQIFDVWCLHIPVMDRTPFTDLVVLVERTVRSENFHSPKRPIYLVGESLGACLALSVAARNPDIDLILILANPATCFSKSQLQPLIPLLQIMPEQLPLSVPYILSLMTGFLASFLIIHILALPISCCIYYRFELATNQLEHSKTAQLSK